MVGAQAHLLPSLNSENRRQRPLEVGDAYSSDEVW